MGRSKNSLHLFIFAALALAFVACADKSAENETPARANPEASAPALKSLSPLPTRELSREWGAAQSRAMTDVARIRGLSWREEVGMTPLLSWEYAARTQELADALGAEDLQNLSGLAAAGGMIPEGTDLVGVAVSFASLTANASYSPPDRRVLLRSDDPSAAPRQSLLAHEFVHALQDQHFDLLSLLVARPYDFDRTEAVFALVEGDAMSVQRRLEGGDAFTRRALEEVSRAEDARLNFQRRQLGWLFPPLITETFIFRYRDGLRFVETVRRSRGSAGVDEAFRRPPTTSEQILHPEKYFANEGAKEAGLEEARFSRSGWRVAASTPLGEIGVRGVLLAGLSQLAAVRAASGWGGDRAYSLARDEGGATLFVWKTVWDSERDAREFFDAYNSLKRLRASATDADESRALWNEGPTATLVRIEGDAVLIVRGSREDVLSVE